MDFAVQLRAERMTLVQQRNAVEPSQIVVNHFVKKPAPRPGHRRAFRVSELDRGEVVDD